MRKIYHSGRPQAFVAIFLVAAAGVAAVSWSRAATPVVTFEAENGIVSGNASKVPDATASNAGSVKFNAASPSPPPLSGWPNASNVGLLTATTKTLAGGRVDDTAWFAQNGFPGAGTQADPYIIDKVTFTSQLTFGCACDSPALTGKYVKITNSRMYGSGGNPTPGGSAFLWIADDGPFVTITDSTLAPNQTPLTSGGTTLGTDKGIFSYVPFTALRNNIYGANVLVGFEIERSEGPTLIQDNFLHDIWSCCDDHTDIINGNFHASHITVRHNYLDGIRVNNSYVTNGIGIYDDPSTSAGIIEDWTIDNNYFDRSATMILSNTSTSRFLNPFILTNNTFTNRYTVNRVITRAPSQQSGNVDQNGNPLIF